MTGSSSAAARGAGRSGVKEKLWREHLARQAAGKLSIREYCARAGVSEPSFYAWRRELARRDATTGQRAEPRKSQAASSRPASRQVEAAVRKSAAASHPANAAPLKPAAGQRQAHCQPCFLPVSIAGAIAASQVEMLLPSGLIVRVPAQDVAALRTVLELLERPTC